MGIIHSLLYNILPAPLAGVRKAKVRFLPLHLGTCALKFECQPVREEHPFHTLAYGGNTKAVAPWHSLFPEL